MFWTDRINRVAGVTLLLLALGIILSIVFSEATTDADPFERNEVEEFLRDVNGNEGLAIAATLVDVATDAAIGIVAAAGLYLVFRERNRLLALFGFALIFGGGVAFMAGDAATVPLILLAQDFVEKGGPGGIAAGDDVILETARAVAIWSFVIDQIAVTAIGVGLIAFGSLIAWTPAGAGPVPPRWLGGLAVLAGLATILSWIGAASEGVGIVLFIVGAIAMLLFLISLGIWLLMQPEAGEAIPAPSPAPSGGGTPLQP
jgi:hypothetical protein